MREIREIFQSLCRIAPLELQMDFDNSGFLLGHERAEVTRCLLALDVTDDVIDEAIERKAELIISHHPVIFHPLKAVNDTEPAAKRVLRLAENRIAVISMHTNLDIAEGGVNDVLMETLGGECEGGLDADGCGRVGRLKAPEELPVFLDRCKAVLHCDGLRYVDAGRPVYRLAVMGGSGADSIQRAFALGCDTLVTADVKYHQFQTAQDLGLNLIDADHFCTENPVIPALLLALQNEFPDLEFSVSARHCPIVRFA